MPKGSARTLLIPKCEAMHTNNATQNNFRWLCLCIRTNNKNGFFRKAFTRAISERGKQQQEGYLRYELMWDTFQPFCHKMFREFA